MSSTSLLSFERNGLITWHNWQSVNWLPHLHFNVFNPRFFPRTFHRHSVQTKSTWILIPAGVCAEEESFRGQWGQQQTCPLLSFWNEAILSYEMVWSQLYTIWKWKSHHSESQVSLAEAKLLRNFSRTQWKRAAFPHFPAEASSVCVFDECLFALLLVTAHESDRST